MFLTFLLVDGGNPDPDPYKIFMLTNLILNSTDPDPGGPKHGYSTGPTDPDPNPQHCS